MLTFRSVDASVRAHIAGLFTSPPAQTLPAPWNVYGEDAFGSDEFRPQAPYVFLLEARVRPRQTRLPLVQIERGSAVYAPLELGTRLGSAYVYNIHVFARNRGERGDLAAFLFNGLDVIRLYDYAVTPPTFKYAVSVESKASIPQAQREDVGLEGALLNFESIVFEVVTKE